MFKKIVENETCLNNQVEHVLSELGSGHPLG